MTSANPSRPSILDSGKDRGVWLQGWRLTWASSKLRLSNVGKKLLGGSIGSPADLELPTPPLAHWDALKLWKRQPWRRPWRPFNACIRIAPSCLLARKITVPKGPREPSVPAAWRPIKARGRAAQGSSASSGRSGRRARYRSHSTSDQCRHNRSGTGPACSQCAPWRARRSSHHR